MLCFREFSAALLTEAYNLTHKKTDQFVFLHLNRGPNATSAGFYLEDVIDLGSNEVVGIICACNKGVLVVARPPVVKIIVNQFQSPITSNSIVIAY